MRLCVGEIGKADKGEGNVSSVDYGCLTFRANGITYGANNGGGEDEGTIALRCRTVNRNN